MQADGAGLLPPPLSSFSSAQSAVLPRQAQGDAKGTCHGHSEGSVTCTDCGHGCRYTGTSASITGNTLYTPPESCYSAGPSSTLSASKATIGVTTASYPDCLYPPPQTAHALRSGSSASHSLQHHLPKSLSRSSISSDGSILLFSPSVEIHHLQNCSPPTPPLSLPLATTSKSATLPEQRAMPSRLVALSAESAASVQTCEVPILPNMESTADKSGGKLPSTSLSIITPACISQLATYLAEMMVYLWFSPPQKRAPTFPKPTSAFARFCNDILTTTQVSQSVVVLALYFVCKLQTKHSIEPRPGSEYKLTIASLMLANKILDDHTYTNKTWSEVSGLPLGVLNGAEVEFLQGLNFDLHVSHTAYLAWYTMLQNGESSNIVKRTVPSRKKPRIINPIAPSAPTSPLHHSSVYSTAASSGPGCDFSFATPCAATATSAMSMTAPPMPSMTWPSNAQIMHESSMFYASSAEPALSMEPTFPTRQRGNRKRRMSDAALSPPRSAMAAPAHSPGIPSPFRMAIDNIPSAGAVPSLRALPPHIYTPIITTPTAIMSAVPSNSSTPNAKQIALQSQQGQSHLWQTVPQADFNALTSSWSPADQVTVRKPQDLTYYALAAGQQNGGYLTHQPLQPMPAIPRYSHTGMPMHHVQGGRAYAPLPRNGFLSSVQPNSTPRAQQSTLLPRTSLSLSPMDLRIMYEQQIGRQYPYSPQYSTPPLASSEQHAVYPPMSMANQARLVPQMTSRGYALPEYQKASTAVPHRTTPLSQGQLSSPLEPSLQNLALSSQNFQRNATPAAHAERLQQSHTQPQSLSLPYQSYYSSFANNGLPGILSWPVHALANYHNVVHPQ